MNERKKLGKQLLAFLLAVILTVEAIPLEVQAEKGVTPETIDIMEPAPNHEQGGGLTIINEEISKREEYGKHFRMSDGSMAAASYLEPVHFIKDGEWVEYDNSLVEVAGDETDVIESTEEETIAEEMTAEAVTEEESAETEMVSEEVMEVSEKKAENVELKNKTSDVDIRLSKKTNGKKFVRIEKDGYKISWYYKNAEKVEGQYLEQEADGDEMTLEQTKSHVLYEDVFPQVDLEYVVGSTGLKENLVLKSGEAETSFEAEYKVNGLTPVSADSQTIELQDAGGNVIYRILAPYMMDAEGEICEEVTLILSAVNSNKFTVQITLDEKWLAEENRVWPVTVDPLIETKRSRADIDTTYIASSDTYKNTNLSTRLISVVGWETSSYGYTRTLIKFNLPALNKGDMVVSASLAMVMYHKSFYTSSMKDQQISAHAITSSWNLSQVTWSNQPSYDPMVSDYSYIKQSDVENGYNWKQFDITSVVKKWYEEKLDNNGILIKQQVEGGSKAQNAANGWFWTEKYNEVTDAYPAILINYRNNKGLEDYWSYSAYGIGSAGNAYVNDYSGNLVYELPVLTSNSEIAPLALAGYYNTYCAGEPLGKAEDGTVHTSLGKGFRLNLQMTVLESSKYGLTETSATNYPYVYTDGDGTEHYIQKVTEGGKTEYKDEDGLGITLRIHPNTDKDASYQITDKAGNDYYFNSNGTLISWYDNNENRSGIEYKPAASGVTANSRIYRIKDGAGHTYTFAYHTDSNGIETDYVHQITDHAGRVITFEQEDGFLKSVTYSDGTKTQLTYGTDSVIDTICSQEGYKLKFSYTDKEKGKRVNAIREYGLNTDTGEFETGQLVTFLREEYNTTQILSAGADGIHWQDTLIAEDDILTTLQFDNMGRTVSQQVSYITGEEIGAGAYEYTSGTKDKTTAGFKNKISANGSLGKNTENMLNGGNAENLNDWEALSQKYGALTTTQQVSAEQVYMGKGALKIYTSRVATGEKSWLEQELDGSRFIPGENYTLSAYVKTESVSQIYKEKDMGAYLQLIACGANTEGTESELEIKKSEALTGTTEEAVNNGWRRIYATINIPEDMDTLKVQLLLGEAHGTAYFDCIQLEKGLTPSTYNLLENASFEQSSGGLPARWSKVSDASYQVGADGKVIQGVSNERRKDGERALRVPGADELWVGYAQYIPVEGNLRDTYIVSGWAYGYPISDMFHSDAANYEIAYHEIDVRVIYDCYNSATGQTTSVTQHKNAVKFNTAVTGWQYASVPLVLAYKDPASGMTYTPKEILIMPRYTEQANYVFYDHLMLAKEPAETYAYDSKGNVTSVSANAEQKNDMSYDGNDLKTYKDLAGYETKFNYDSKHNLTSMESATGITTSYSYSGTGNVLSTEMKNSAGTQALRSENTYSEEESSLGILAGAYLTKTSDQNGNETSYMYAMSTGAMQSVTDPAGNVTTYAYYGNDERLAGVSSGGTEVTYEYETRDGVMLNRLSEITVTGEEEGAPSENYRFEYDKWGNVTKTYVGNTALATTAYNDSGMIEDITYADGYSKWYTYNKDGTLSGIMEWNTDGNIELGFVWNYDTNGTVLEEVSWGTKDKYNYEYDSLGRFVRQKVHNTMGTGLDGYTEYGYDERNNINKVSNTVGSKTFTQNFCRHFTN